MPNRVPRYAPTIASARCPLARSAADRPCPIRSGSAWIRCTASGRVPMTTAASTAPFVARTTKRRFAWHLPCAPRPVHSLRNATQPRARSVAPPWAQLSQACEYPACASMLPIRAAQRRVAAPPIAIPPPGKCAATASATRTALRPARKAAIVRGKSAVSLRGCAVRPKPRRSR
jgi:hypothetical protein